MRLWVLCGLLLVGALTQAGAPRALVLDGTVLAPVRVFADWLGGEVRYDAQAQTVTLTKDAAMLQVTANRRAATQQGQPITLPAPAAAIDGVLYVPARTLAAVFGCPLDWKARPATLTMHRDGMRPLVIPAQAFPRPTRIDDTLAGLTSGDHLALAIARWGDPEGVGESTVPGAQNYTFAAGEIPLTVAACDDKIVLIRVDLPTGDIARDLRRQTGTAHGLHLGDKAFPVAYRVRLWAEVSETGDTATLAYRRGQLAIVKMEMLNWDTDSPPQALFLTRHDAPHEWFVF